MAHNQPSEDVLDLLKTQLVLAREVDALWGVTVPEISLSLHNSNASHYMLVFFVC
jgi:hypothetical protein